MLEFIYMKNLVNVLETFYEKKVLVIGDVMLDKYTFGNVQRISPEAPVPVIMVEREEYKPGGAGNVALNVANLSPKGEVYLFGFIGKDDNGYKLERILEERGIKCYFEENNQTIMKERVIGRSYGQQQHIVRIDREENSPKKFSSIEEILKIAEKVDKIIISDYAKGAITKELMGSLNSYKGKMIIDPRPTNKDFNEIYKNAFLITPNKNEAFKMSGVYDVDNAGEKLRKKFDSNILITLGKDGMKLFTINNEKVEIKTIPEESFEETGAGDTAIATVALALCSLDNSLESLINAAKLGNYAAGITVKNIGTYAPTLDELRNKLLSLIQK